MGRRMAGPLGSLAAHSRVAFPIAAAHRRTLPVPPRECAASMITKKQDKHSKRLYLMQLSE